MIIDIRTRKPSTVEELYNRERDAIGVYWSVLSNLESYDGKEAKELECICLGNIRHYSQLPESAINRMSRNVPGYVRLCMLYEKQGRYADAVEVCKQAISAGATEDGNPGKMFGRLARVSRKACIERLREA